MLRAQQREAEQRESDSEHSRTSFACPSASRPACVRVSGLTNSSSSLSRADRWALIHDGSLLQSDGGVRVTSGAGCGGGGGDGAPRAGQRAVEANLRGPGGESKRLTERRRDAHASATEPKNRNARTQQRRYITADPAILRLRSIRYNRHTPVCWVISLISRAVESVVSQTSTKHDRRCTTMAARV